MSQLSKTEIDALIAEEVATESKQTVNSVDALNHRRMTCKFFGHSRLLRLDKYKGCTTYYCEYCAEIIGYGSRRNMTKSPSPVFFWNWMLDDGFLLAIHPEDKKRV